MPRPRSEPRPDPAASRHRIGSGRAVSRAAVTLALGLAAIVLSQSAGLKPSDDPIEATSTSQAVVAAANPPVSGNSVDRCPADTPSYRSRPDLKPIGICAARGTGQTAPGYLFTATKQPGGGGETIFDNEGTVVWHRPEILADVHNLQVVTIGGKQRLVYYAGAWLTEEVDSRGSYIVLDEHYREIGRIRSPDSAASGLHELQITADDTALIGAYVPVLRVFLGRPLVVFDYVVREIDFQHGGAVLFEWRALDHIPLEQSHLPVPGQFGSFDYFHGNSIDVMSDGNLLISGRNTGGIYKVSRADGRVIWTLGMVGNGPGTFGPSLAGSEFGWFCYQHDAREQEDGTITLFDNGGAGPGCRHSSRSLTIRLDPSAGVARVVKEFRHTPDISAAFSGNNDVLPNGNHLVSWGDKRLATEFGPEGTPTLELSLGQIVYRIHRSPWKGFPESPPDAIVERGEESRVYVSWNGATEVTRWRVLGGPTADSVRPLGPPVAKQGFETSMVIPSDVPVVVVEALDAKGRPLPHGRAIAAASADPARSVVPHLSRILDTVRGYSAMGFNPIWAVIGGLIIGVPWTLVRLLRRVPLGPAAGGLAGIVAAAVMAGAIGRPYDVQPLAVVVGAAYLAVLVVANLLNRPLTGTVIGLVAGWGPGWRRDSQLLHTALRAGWLWAGLLAVKVGVALVLYTAGAMVALDLARFTLSWPAMLLASWLTCVIVRRGASGPRVAGRSR